MGTSKCSGIARGGAGSEIAWRLLEWRSVPTLVPALGVWWGLALALWWGCPLVAALVRSLALDWGCPLEFGWESQ